MCPISSAVVEVDENVTGHQWSVTDLDDLARLIAVVALGQAEHAARIIADLEPHGPALSDADLFREARSQLRIRGETEDQREVSAYHRDGFMFECISWIVARQEADERTFMKDPHISSTTQGLDGLVIRMHAIDPIVIQSTIMEDKCTKNARRKFKQEVLKTFTDHHESKRSRELVANAAALIKASGLNGTQAVQAAARVLDKQFRVYRAALTVPGTLNTSARRSRLFKGYDSLANIGQVQRVGAMFPVAGTVRSWFQELAERTIQMLTEFEQANV